jgi:hypothetical protein
MALRDEVNQRATEYWNETADSEQTQLKQIPMSVVDFVIEYFGNTCNLPYGTTDEQLQRVLESHKNEMAMACVNVLAHAGMEGQTETNENGIRRTYDASWISKQLLQNLPNFIKIY